MIHSKNGALKEIPGSGIPLGIDPFHTKFSEARLEEEEKLLLFTDGIIEIQSLERRRLRIVGLSSILKETTCMNASDTTAFVPSGFESFRTPGDLEDDATFITLKRL